MNSASQDSTAPPQAKKQKVAATALSPPSSNPTTPSPSVLTQSSPSKNLVERPSIPDIINMFSKNVKDLALDCVDTIAFEIGCADSDQKVREIMWELKLLVAGTVAKSCILQPADVKGFRRLLAKGFRPT